MGGGATWTALTKLSEKYLRGGAKLARLASRARSEFDLQTGFDPFLLPKSDRVVTAERWR